MLEPVELVGRWWAHNGACSEVEVGPHVHYGQHVIVSLDTQHVPEDVLDAYHVLFGNPDVTTPQGVVDPYEAA